jgi:hypothetical protein
MLAWLFTEPLYPMDKGHLLPPTPILGAPTAQDLVLCNYTFPDSSRISQKETAKFLFCAIVSFSVTAPDIINTHV